MVTKIFFFFGVPLNHLLWPYMLLSAWYPTVTFTIVFQNNPVHSCLLSLFLIHYKYSYVHNVFVKILTDDVNSTVDEIFGINMNLNIFALLLKFMIAVWPKTDLIIYLVALWK